MFQTRPLQTRSNFCSSIAVSRLSLLCLAVRGSLKQRKRQPEEIVVGIDLGTTNSLVAYIKDGKPVCIPNQHGSKITPSTVAYTENGTVLIGQAAKRQAVLNPTNTFYSVKRLIGRKYSDPLVQNEVARLAYEVATDDQGEVVLPCEYVEGGMLYPQEVSGQILAQLLNEAEQFTGGRIEKAVVSVPAYFNERQRQGTVEAGKLAGLKVVRLITEPVAAALAYGLDLQEDQVVLVVDLGGGTYDISLLEVGGGTVEVLSTGGNPHLGGDDFDTAIAEWLQTKQLEPAGVDCTTPRVRANLKTMAEVAKLGLSTNEQVLLRVPVGPGKAVEVSLSRSEFDKLCEPLWQRCRLPLDVACWQAGVDLEAVVAEAEQKRAELLSRGVPSWKVM